MSQCQLNQDQRIAELRLRPPSRRSHYAGPEKRRSVWPGVIAAFVVIGLAAFLLSNRGNPTPTGWQNLHPPVVPTQLTPDGAPGRPAMPVPAK